MKDKTSTKCVCTDLTEVTSGSLTLPTVYQVYCVMFRYQLSGSCGTPSSLSNGLRRYSSTIIGSTVTYTCNTGYLRTAGSSSRTCQSSGLWSGTHPTCEGKSQVPLHLELYLVVESISYTSCSLCSLSLNYSSTEQRGAGGDNVRFHPSKCPLVRPILVMLSYPHFSPSMP